MLYYVYCLARPAKVKRRLEWRVFYVGKGNKRRVFAHEGEARNGHQCHKCNIIRKVWREGCEIQRYIMLTTENEQEAYDYERELIALHGRENLCNKTDGGDDPPHNLFSQEQRERRSEKTRKSWYNPFIRARRITQLQVAMKRPDEQSRRSDATRISWQNPETRAKRSAGIKITRNTAESKAKTSAASKAMYTPERRFQYSEMMKERYKDPDARRRQSERMKEVLALKRSMSKQKNTSDQSS